MLNAPRGKSLLLSVQGFVPYVGEPLSCPASEQEQEAKGLGCEGQPSAEERTAEVEQPVCEGRPSAKSTADVEQPEHEGQPAVDSTESPRKEQEIVGSRHDT